MSANTEQTADDVDHEFDKKCMGLESQTAPLNHKSFPSLHHLFCQWMFLREWMCVSSCIFLAGVVVVEELCVGCLAALIVKIINIIAMDTSFVY